MLPLNFGTTSLPLLHIDDDRDDRYLVREAVRLTGTPFTVCSVSSLAAGMEYFRPEGNNDQPSLNPRPALVLLDYEIGDCTGVEFLTWLRLEKRITDLPVVMLSGSSEMREISACYAAGVDHFLAKPSRFSHLEQIIQKLYQCLSQNPPNLDSLHQLPEYQPDSAQTRRLVAAA